MANRQATTLLAATYTQSTFYHFFFLFSFNSPTHFNSRVVCRVVGMQTLLHLVHNVHFRKMINVRLYAMFKYIESASIINGERETREDGEGDWGGGGGETRLVIVENTTASQLKSHANEASIWIFRHTINMSCHPFFGMMYVYIYAFRRHFHGVQLVSHCEYMACCASRIGKRAQQVVLQWWCRTGRGQGCHGGTERCPRLKNDYLLLFGRFDSECQSHNHTRHWSAHINKQNEWLRANLVR